MKNSRFTEEQIVHALRQTEAGTPAVEVCRKLGVSEQTYYRWRNQIGGLKADHARRLKDLERENATLKRLLANVQLGTRQRRSPGETSEPEHRAAVHHLIRTTGVSERFACR